MATLGTEERDGIEWEGEVIQWIESVVQVNPEVTGGDHA